MSRSLVVRTISRAALGTAWRAYARARDAGEDPTSLAFTPLIGVTDRRSPRAMDPQQSLLLLDRYDQIADSIEEWMDEDDELTYIAATRGVLNGLHSDLVDIAGYFGDLVFPLIVYRGILVPMGESVRRQGASWTPNRAIAEAFADGGHDASEVTHAGLEKTGGGRSVLLQGTIVSSAGVDWRETFALFHDYSLGVLGDDRQAEEEIRVKDHGSVRDVHEIPMEDA